MNRSPVGQNSWFALKSYRPLGLRHRDEWKEKGRRFRQRFHIGPGYEPHEDDHPHELPNTTCTVQVVRSVSDWSHGVLKETSIQNACEYLFSPLCSFY